MSIPLAACAAGGAASPDAAAHPAPAAPREAVFTWDSVPGEAGARRYRLFVPASYHGSGDAPLLVMLHGCTQDPDDLARGTRMNRVAEEHGMLVAYPEQTADRQPQKCWSWYEPAHQERGRGEPEEIVRVARRVMAGHRVDPARVYVAGISAGGAMALNVAAAYPDLFAAAATHSGVPYRAAGGVQEALRVMQRGAPDTHALGRAVLAALGSGARPLPVIAIHGGADAVVSPRNLEQTVHQWAAASEGAGVPLRLQGDGSHEPSTDGFRPTVTRFEDHAGSTVLEMWLVPGLGHAWSGGSPEGTFTEPRGPDASREIVRFLLAHPRTGR